MGMTIKLHSICLANETD